MNEDTKITLPYNFTPRSYQINVWNAFVRDGFKRGLCVWHRRAGKDLTFFNILVTKAFERVGIYYYYFPTKADGRAILWEGMDKEGVRFLDRIPPDLRDGEPKNVEMQVALKNGSLFRVMGTDDLRVVGPNPVGCVFSEYSLQNPAGWDLIRPILAENDGWAIFNFTPRGRNHAYREHLMAKNNPAYFHELLTVDDTNAISQEAIQAERDSGMREELIQQEFWCSFSAALEGAFYADDIALAREEGRIGVFRYRPELPVHTAWDLGISHPTVIWFWQEVQEDDYLWYDIIDYYQNTGQSLNHYAGILRQKGYQYGDHWGPHDIKVREQGTGISRLETLLGLGVRMNVVPKLGVEDGIEAVHQMFHRCRFNEATIQQGLDGLSAYRAEFDPKKDKYRPKPVDDWSADPADAFRMMATRRKSHVALASTNNKISRCLVDRVAI